MTSTISDAFARLKSAGRMAFMPFVTAGDPDMAATRSLLAELSARQVDLIEVGFPYSDPIADGPVIQASYTRALDKHITTQAIFDGIAALKGKTSPLVAMVSYAIVFRSGPKEFLRRAREAGFAGLIVPDLPGDEAADMFATTREAGLDLIQLIAPTTPPERVREILKHCSGFVYCIAVAGTTGARDSIAPELLNQLKWLRSETSLPLCVGFGISQPEHLAPLKGLADGAIVGSAIVRKLQDVADGKLNSDQAIREVGDFSARMVAAAKSLS
jgi:tryptophan synthase alpha chain